MTISRKLLVALFSVLLGLSVVPYFLFPPRTACQQVREAQRETVDRYHEVLGIPTLNADVRVRLVHELDVIQEGPCWHQL